MVTRIGPLRNIFTFSCLFIPKHWYMYSSRRVRLLLNGVGKDTNYTQDMMCLTSTKSSWLPSMNCMEYIVKITETVISPEVQFKCHYSGTFSTLAFIQLIALRPVYRRRYLLHFQFFCRSGQFSHSRPHITYFYWSKFIEEDKSVFLGEYRATS